MTDAAKDRSEDVNQASPALDVQATRAAYDDTRERLRAAEHEAKQKLRMRETSRQEGFTAEEGEPEFGQVRTANGMQLAAESLRIRAIHKLAREKLEDARVAERDARERHIDACRLRGDLDAAAVALRQIQLSERGTRAAEEATKSAAVQATMAERLAAMAERSTAAGEAMQASAVVQAMMAKEQSEAAKRSASAAEEQTKTAASMRRYTGVLIFVGFAQVIVAATQAYAGSHNGTAASPNATVPGAASAASATSATSVPSAPSAPSATSTTGAPTDGGTQ